MFHEICIPRSPVRIATLELTLPQSIIIPRSYQKPRDLEVGHLSRPRLAYSSGTMRREIGVNFAQVFAAAALLFLSEHEIKEKERPGNPNNMYAIFLSPLLLVFSCYILAGARINISLFIKGTRRRILNGTLNPRALVTSNAALSPSLFPSSWQSPLRFL